MKLHSVTDIRTRLGSRQCRDKFLQVATRRHFITKQDCRYLILICLHLTVIYCNFHRNICRKLRDFTTHRHAEDAISVDRIIKELQQESPSPILLYKPQGVTNPDHTSLGQSSFLIVIMTAFQASILNTFSHKIVCLDSTHKTNQYRFKLLTLIVPDEYRNGEYINTRK